ncbi:hypothetical protein GOODEAATRI_014567 [Goodea atripinnis]|uniref:Uncharacterized protein n=1 Tax=Goodea atripinnis TaxID=208336 RepID=A0ABV0NUN2_9TELE
MTSSSCGRLNFLSCLRKYSLCWAFFQTVSMCEDHLRSSEMVVPKNLKWSTADTVLLRMVRGVYGGGVLRKSTTISTVYILFSSVCSSLFNITLFMPVFIAHPPCLVLFMHAYNVLPFLLNLFYLLYCFCMPVCIWKPLDNQCHFSLLDITEPAKGHGGCFFFSFAFACNTFCVLTQYSLRYLAILCGIVSKPDNCKNGTNTTPVFEIY